MNICSISVCDHNGRNQRSPCCIYLHGVPYTVVVQDDIRDLLLQDTPGAHSVQIRELSGGGICLAGSVEKEVTTKAEMAEILRLGTLQRATAATGMNKHSSRSHAIFTITVEQRRKVREADSETQSSTKVQFGLQISCQLGIFS